MITDEMVGRVQDALLDHSCGGLYLSTIRAALETIEPMVEKLIKEQREQIASAIEEEADELDINLQPADHWDAHQYFKQRLHDMAAIAYGDQK